MATLEQLRKAVSNVEFLEAFESGAEVRNWPWQLISSQRKATGLTESVFGFSMLGEAAVTRPNQAIHRSEIAELPETLFSMFKTTISTTLPHEARFNRHIKDLAGRVGKSMGRSLSYTRDKLLASVLNAAFDATAQPMYDGRALCDTHTMRSGHIVENELPPSSLTYDTVWDCIDYMRVGIYNHAGMLASTSNNYYLITRDNNARTVKKILEAKGEPDTTDLNNPNALPKITPIFCPFLTSTSSFFIANGDFKDDFLFFDLEGPKYKTADDLTRHGTIYMAWSIYGFGVKEFFNIVGNPGA